MDECKIQCASHRPPRWGRFELKMFLQARFQQYFKLSMAETMGLLKYFAPQAAENRAPECTQNRSPTGLSGGAVELPEGSQEGPGGAAGSLGIPGGVLGAQDGSKMAPMTQLGTNLEAFLAILGPT